MFSKLFFNSLVTFLSHKKRKLQVNKKSLKNFSLEYNSWNCFRITYIFIYIPLLLTETRFINGAQYHPLGISRKFLYTGIVIGLLILHLSFCFSVGLLILQLSSCFSVGLLILHLSFCFSVKSKLIIHTKIYYSTIISICYNYV